MIQTLHTVVFFAVDSDIFPIALRIVGSGFVQFSLCQKDFDGGNPATHSSNKKDYRGKCGEKSRQKVDHEPEAD